MLYRPNIVTLREFSLDVVSRSARDLSLLQAIEQTIDALLLQQKRISADAQFANTMAKRISEIKPATPLDSDSDVGKLLGQAQEGVKRYYDLLIVKRQSAIDDARLADEDGVVEEYSRTIALAAELYNALNSLSWAIGEHDAEFSPRKKDGPVLSSPEAIDAYLKTL